MTPPPLRDAATIILARDRNNRLEIYLLKRSSQSGFMGGLYVFPGGTVDRADRVAGNWMPHIDLSGEQLERQLCDDLFDCESAVAFGVAAIRETLEEAGVFIASTRNRPENQFRAMALLRLQKDLPRDWFYSRVQSESWTLLFSHLGRWSHWITPERMKKRFDTRFFIVLMPENQTCAPDLIETKQGLWITPQAALEQNLTGQTPLSPPAVMTLTDLSQFMTLEELKNEMENHTWGDPIAPVLYPTDDGPVILEPWDPHFKKNQVPVFENLKERVLDAGEPFSRIWCDQGVWKPVDL